MLNEEFYKLYPSITDSSIQLFNDQKGGGGKILRFTQDGLNKAMEANKKGKGVFFSANSMVSGTRSKSNTTNIKARICESDNLSKEEQLDRLAECPIMPSCIVESKSSYHMYWFCKDGDKETYETINRGLAEFFDGDGSICTDRSRVLRLPGYYHKKDPSDPFVVNCIHIEETFFTKEEMIQAYPWKNKAVPKQDNPKDRQSRLPLQSPTTYNDKGGKVGDSSIVRFSKTWNCEDMLMQISGSSMVNGDSYDFKPNSNGTKQIVVNGIPCGCWIDRDGMIGSSSNGGPTWVNRVRWYHNRSSDYIEDWVYDNCRNRLSEESIGRYEHKRGIKKTKEQIKKEEEKKKQKAIQNSEHIWKTEKIELNYDKKVAITWGIPHVDQTLKKLTLQDFVILVAYPGSGKTLYGLFMAEKNGLIGHKSTFFSLELSKDVLYERTAVEHAGIDWNNRLDAKISKGERKMVESRLDQLNNIKNVNIVGAETGVDINTLVAGIRKFHKEGSTLFFIDNLGKIRGSENENARFDNITSILQDLMKELNIFILVMHHLGKPQKGGEYLPGGGSAFRGTQKIKDNCTCMAEIRYDRSENATEDQRSTVQIIQYKRTRAGGADRVGMMKYYSGTYISDDDYYSMKRESGAYEEVRF